MAKRLLNSGTKVSAARVHSSHAFACHSLSSGSRIRPTLMHESCQLCPMVFGDRTHHSGSSERYCSDVAGLLAFVPLSTGIMHSYLERVGSRLWRVDLPHDDAPTRAVPSHRCVTFIRNKQVECFSFACASAVVSA